MKDQRLSKTPSGRGRTSVSGCIIILLLGTKYHRAAGMSGQRGKEDPTAADVSR